MLHITLLLIYQYQTFIISNINSQNQPSSTSSPKQQSKLQVDDQTKLYINQSYIILSADLNSMATSTAFNVSKIIPTNITSSLTISADYAYFATITRQLSTVSSQWIYRLDFYDFNKLTKLESTDIYQSYNTDKHFLVFIPTRTGPNLLALSTINNLYFYKTNPLRRVAGFLHNQANVYDLTASPDGQLTVLVGQTIVMYRNNGFKPIIFPQVIQNARYCDFSLDGKYMAISSTSSLNIYTFVRNNDNYQFQQIPLNSTAQVQYGTITSIQFNPNNSSQIIVGFLSTSPLAYSLSTGTFFKKITDIQPMSSQNAKIAKYMPDGVRFYSYDYLNGVGLWPGATQRLFYQQNFLLYDASANQYGTKMIGFVWQTIKVVNINVKCKDTKLLDISCPCPIGQAWNYANYQCQTLSCQQAEYATGIIQINSCECIPGYIFSTTYLKCVIDCSIINKALPIRPYIYQCYCQDNWSWNSATRRCEFDCTQISYSSGVPIGNNNECQCLPGFNWDHTMNECICPQYMQPSGNYCVCLNNYYFEPTYNKCLANCSIITTAIGTASNPQQCICGPSYYYIIKDGIAGCQLNCSAIADTTQQKNYDSCICHEHMDWYNNSCVVNCQAIQYSDPIPMANNTCACAINYLWIDRIKECARDCTGVKHIIAGADSTLISCPCIKNFLWSESNTRCEIQCKYIENSQDYSLRDIDKCQCRSGFNWNPDQFNCRIDCSQIWNAETRINDSYCSCKNSQDFNNKTLTCSVAGAAGLFSDTLSIVGFAVGCVVALVIMVILVRFCWKFSTDSNKQHQKKIKGKDTKKKNKLIRKQKVHTGQQQIKTNQRFTSPAKKTATNTTL